MKSTLTFRFDGDPTHGGTLAILINNSLNDMLFSETSQAQRLAPLQFVVVLPLPVAAQPYFAFVTAWNIDWKDTGGFDNVKARTYFSGGFDWIEIEIDNENWTFTSITPSLFSIADVTISNATPPLSKYYDHAITGADCTDAFYDIDIFGGTSPYTITGLPYGDVTGVGASGTFTLQRGTPASVRVYDSLGVDIQTKSIVPPKNLKSGNFTITVTPVGASNTVTVEPNIVIENDILPIEYSLNGVDYSTTNSFTGLLYDSTFTMYIKDAYGCVITKTFVTLVDNGTGTEQQYIRYFKLSNAGTLIANEVTTYTNQVKKNPYNTLSCDEMVKIPYGYIHEFDGGEIAGQSYFVQQFKSSYGYHKITLITNGIAKYIEPILQYENLNQQEKVDAKLFRTALNKTGLYFDGGANYIPNTTTVDSSNPSSPYTASNLPSWAKVGQVVSLDGIGAKTVTRITTDSQRGLYMEFNDTNTSTVDVAVLVQADYNRQNYNLYEFIVPMSMVEGTGRIFIEVGFNDLVERTFATELLQKITDDDGKSLLLWNDPENKSAIVHQTGIKHCARLGIRLTHRTVSASELANQDDRAVSLDQEAYVVADFECVVKGFMMENKLALASGMENFIINGINYKKETWDSEVQGDSNIYVIKGLLRLGANELSIEGDDIVLDPPSTPLTQKPAIPATIPNILALDTDVLVRNGDGGFILVDNG